MKDKLTPIAEDLTPAAVSFHNKDGKTIGKFIMDSEKLRFEGDADKSAKTFIKLVLRKFNKK
jgi:hypothetical protein